MSKATGDRQPLAAACLMLLVFAAIGTIFFGAAAPTSAATATTTYDTATHIYDSSSSLLTQDVAAPSRRGSPATLPAAPQEDSVSLGRFGVAANTAGTAASTVRVGPGAALENITGGDALRIQNAANRVGQPMSTTRENWAVIDG